MKILVTDGDNRASLAITRALGREGHHVVVGASHRPSLAGVSRYCRQHIVYPDPSSHPRAFVQHLLRCAQDLRPDVIMPVSEITTILITEQKQALSRFSRVPFPDSEIVKQAADKAYVLKLAAALDVPIPETVFLEKPSHIQEKRNKWLQLGYPIVIKPSRSRYLTHSGWMYGKVNYAKDQDELIEMLENLAPEAYPLLLQTRIVGSGVGIFFLANHGKIISIFSHRRLREKPPSGGVSVLRESFPVDPKLQDYSQRLLQALGWHGVGMVEFKKNDYTGEYELMEINGRFWGSLQLAIDAGVNFPCKLAQIAIGKDLPVDFNFDLGVKTRWLWGDFDALLTRLLKPNNRLKLPPGFPSRRLCLLAFLKFKEKGQKFEVFDTSDLKPWLLESFRWISRK